MRYIDADELMEKIRKCEFKITGCGIMYDAGGVQSAINTQRSADVVPKSEVDEIFRIFEFLIVTKIRNDADYTIFDMQKDFDKIKKKYTESME